MKKQMKWLLAALALAALATPAFALNADMTGTLGVRAFATDNLDGNPDTKDKNRFVDQRFRLFTSVAANENVKAVLGLEVDNVWGRTTGTVAPATSPAAEVGAVAADAKGQLEIKHLYLDFKIPALGANVKAGTQPFNFGRGLIINDDAAGLAISLPCPALPDNKLDLFWIKTSEGAANTTKTDGDFYGAKYTLKAAGVAIAPYAGYYTTGTDAVTAANIAAGFFGVDVDGKAGPVGYALTAIYNNWNGATTDGDSISLLAKGTMAMGDTSLSLELGSYGDEDNQGGNSMSLTQNNNASTGPLNNASEILNGGMYTTNNAGYAVNSSQSSLYTTNLQYAKIGAVQKLNDAMKVSVFLGHFQQAADVGAADAKTFGQEVDAYFDYTIVPGLGLNLMGAYLLADDDFGDDDAFKLGSSLNYKF